MFQDKIKGIEKTRISLAKQIEKCEREYEKKKGWSEFKDMRYSEFTFKIKTLEDKLYKEYGDDFSSKQSFGNLFKSKLNMLLLKMNISYRFNITTSKMNDIEKEKKSTE